MHPLLPTLWRVIIRDQHTPPNGWVLQRLFYGTQSAAATFAAQLPEMIASATSWADIEPA
jgi:hypothetical protein